MLTLVGRLTLINSVLNTIPIFWMSMLKLPIAIIQEINQKYRRFLWDSQQTLSSVKHLLNWSQVYRPRRFRGLGVKNLSSLNEVLLLKWWWRFFKYPQKPQSQLIKQAYYSRQSLTRPSHHLLTLTSLFWKNMLKLSVIYHQWFCPLVGDGRASLFWYDQWIDNYALSSLLLNLFIFITKQSCSVHEFFQQGNFQFFFRYPMSYQASKEFQRLLNILQVITLNTESDTWICKWGSNGVYSVRASYNFLMHGGVISSLGKSFWSLPVLEKARLFFQLGYHNKILTRDNLIKREVHTTENCLLCDKIGEPINHIMLQCSFSQAY